MPVPRAWPPSATALPQCVFNALCQAREEEEEEEGDLVSLLSRGHASQQLCKRHAARQHAYQHSVFSSETSPLAAGKEQLKSWPRFIVKGPALSK